MVDYSASSDTDVALAGACKAAGLDARGARLVHWGTTSMVYRLAREPVVARLRFAPGAADVLARLAASVAVTRWLSTLGFPATVPLGVAQPVLSFGWIVTFWHDLPAAGWHYIPPSERRSRDIEALAGLLRRLHSLPPPPVRLPAPSLLGSVRADAARCRQLTAGQRSWLLARCDILERRYARATWTLGCGLIHGDAHAGNLIRTPDGVLLGDWDSVSYGPREQDLVPASLGYRFGRQAGWHQLCTLYQADPASLPGLTLLQRLRELRDLAPCLRRAGYPGLPAEVTRRLTDLMTGTQKQPWRALQGDLSR